MKRFKILLYLTLYSPILSVYAFNSKVIENCKKALVEIRFDSFVNLNDSYPNSKNVFSGYVVDKKNGIIISTNDIAKGIVASYEIRFYNGQDVEAKLLYFDPIIDCAFLKVDPKLIPKNINAIKFEKKINLGDKIFVLENNFSGTVSAISGNIIDLYKTSSYVTQHSISLSLNNKGRILGSPVLNSQGNSIGLVYYIGEGNLCLHPEYIDYILKSLVRNSVPVRKHIGAILGYYSLLEAEKYRKFPKFLSEEYRNAFKESKSKAIIITSIIKNTPAYKILEVGDIIWKVNGKLIGPSIISLDMIMNTSKATKMQFEIVRNGQKINREIQLIDLEKFKVKEILKFEDNLFLKSSFSYSRKYGLPLGEICIMTPSYSNIIYRLLGLNGLEVKEINDIIRMADILKIKKYYFIYKELTVPVNFFGKHRLFSKFRAQSIKEYNNFTENALYKFDNKLLKWKKEII